VCSSDLASGLYPTARVSSPQLLYFIKAHIPIDATKDRKNAVAKGNAERVHKLDPGKYHVVTTVKKITVSIEVEVKADRDNHGVIILNAGLLSVKASSQEGGEPLEKAYIYIDAPTQKADGTRNKVTGGNQRLLFTLPAGKYFVRAKLGEAEVGKEIEIIAGKKTDLALVLGSGILEVFALNVEGGKPQLKGSYIRIYELTPQADGTRKQITAANPRLKFTLPAGKYYVTAAIGNVKVGKEVEVIAGKLTKTSIVVGVGALKVAAIPAKGGKPLKKAYIKIFEIEKQLDGSRKNVTGGNPRNTFKLPAGKFLVEARIDGAHMTQEVEITAGKLTESTIILNAGALSVDATRKVYLKLFSADKNLDGTRDHIDSFRAGKPRMYPEGKYVLSGKEGDKTAEVEVEIKAGKLTEVSLKP